MHSLFGRSPLIRIVNLSIAVLLAILLVGVYWYVWRPMPQTSGELVAPVSAEATAARDSLGVPHVKAATWQDAIFLQGFLTAQDRMWQMDALRRLAGGELAEVTGAVAVDSDQQARRLRMGRIAEIMEKNLPESNRELFAAYARGVNYYLDTHRDNLPPEFKILGYQPRPWRVRDSLLAYLEMYRQLTNTWRDELTKLGMLNHARDRAKVDFLYAGTGVGEPIAGSNGWVVAGSRTETGKPILANDPHLQWSVPSTWYMIHLTAPDLDVTGMSIPGIPTVLIGHNRRIAWGLTNLGADVQDLFEESIDLGSGRYVRGGALLQARLERDTIAVKGAKNIELATWITDDGPTFVADNNKMYALRWTADVEAARFDFPVLDIDRASNWDEFNRALSRVSGPAQMVVYADVDGNIGAHAFGRIPIRKGCMGDVPANGSYATCEWTGYIPYDELPHAYNPPSGVIVTANQNPFDGKALGKAAVAAAVPGKYAPPYRANQIRARLPNQPKWRADGMLSVQTDVYSAHGDSLAKQIVAAYERAPNAAGQVRDAIDVLKGWNGQMERGSAGAMLVTLVESRLRADLANAAAPGNSGEWAATYGAPEALDRLLRERPMGWFENYDAWILKALDGAIQEGEKLHGSKVSLWDYGQYNELRFDHPVASKLPMVGSYFSLGPVPMAGSQQTVRQTTSRLGPSMRMIVDLGSLDNSLANVMSGQSGHWLSSHARDQWDAYYNGRSFPMHYDALGSTSTLRFRPK